MAGDQRLQFMIDLDQPLARGERFGGQFAYDGGDGFFAGHDDGLLAGGLKGGVGNAFRLAQDARGAWPVGRS